MTEFRIGDVVRLTAITTEDKRLGRQVGDLGVYLGPDEDYDDCSAVHFYNASFSPYCVATKDLVLERTRNIESILYAFNIDENTEPELINTLKDYMNTDR